MNLSKKNFATILICLLLYGCGFFVAAGQKVSKYCPGLNLKVDGVSWSSTKSRKITVVDYEAGYQKKVDAYFTDKSNGFVGDNPRKYLDLKSSDERAVADGDSILTKSFSKGKTNATVIYNATTRKIIVMEDY